MRFKVRWILALLVFCPVFVILFTDVGAPDKITKSYADRITKGMTTQEVRKLLGFPPTFSGENNPDGPRPIPAYWVGKIGAIRVYLDEDKRVESVTWDGWSVYGLRDEHLIGIDRVLAWFGIN